MKDVMETIVNIRYLNLVSEGLISMFFGISKPSYILHLRQGLEANVIVYNAAINAVGKGKQWKSGLWLLSSMGQQAIPPNIISCNALLSACEKTARWTTALMSLGQRFDTDLISFNTALSSCVRSRWEQGFGIFNMIKMKHLQPDAFTCSGLVRACESSQKWMVALDLCTQAMDLNIQLNVVTSSAAISACQSASQWQQALVFFGNMCSMAMMPNVISYSAILSACEKGSQWEKSLILLAKMEEEKILPDRVACGAALSACETGLQWQLALHLLFSMPVSKLDSVCFTSAISACSKSGCWKDVQLVEAMLKLGISDFSIARYEHSSQAGSTLDCFKHAVYVMLLRLMTSESSPVTCIDTHSGPALYDLGSERGILRLDQTGHFDLQGYIKAALGADPRKYRGSPLLALRWLRSQDHAIFYEMSGEAFRELKDNVQHSFATVTLNQKNSYWHLAHSQHESRTLILMDPPYDPYETYMAWNLFLMQHFYRSQTSQTSMLLWFPYLDDAQVQGLYRRLELLDVDEDDVLVAEFGVQETKTLETSGWARRRGTGFWPP